MGGRGLWLVVVVVMGMVVAGTANTELQCDVECTCQEVKKAYERNYKVVCNASSLQEVSAGGGADGGGGGKDEEKRTKSRSLNPSPHQKTSFANNSCKLFAHFVFEMFANNVGHL